MPSRDKILKETSPLSIVFVKSGSGGNRLLFRYPYDESFQDDPSFEFQNETTTETDRLQMRNVIREGDDALCNMFSVHPNLCGQKFEIKINSVRHVGHPMSLLSTSSLTMSNPTISLAPQSTTTISSHRHHHQQNNLSLSSYDCLIATNDNHDINQGDITSFNIVCSLRASASFDIVDCYHDLSKRLAIALSFEERRCSYLSKEIKTILTALDDSDMANLDSQDQDEHLQRQPDKNCSSPVFLPSGTKRNSGPVFELILNRSNLARDLKKIFICLSTTGIVDLKINNWVSVSFCLPQKVHRLKLMTHKSMPAISARDIKRCLLYLRPYHGLLLLQDTQELLDSLPIDASPAFIQLIKVTKPDKNLMDLSVDANLTLMQVHRIVSQLIYWAKATVIYPICDSNIYAIHPLASVGKHSKLERDFRARFPNSKSLHHYLADFSEGTSLSQLNGPLINVEEKLNLLSIVTWLLQRRILTQVHKYIFLVVDKETSHMTASKPMDSHPNSVNIQQSSPRCIDINVSNNSTNNNISLTNYRSNGMRTNPMQNNQTDSSPQVYKNSLTESIESFFRRYRTDSLPDSQEDSNFGPNSSLSSTPNSNLEYPSPSNETNNRYSMSSSYPLDSPLEIGSVETILSALQRAGMTQAGARNIFAVPSSKNPDDLKLLIRLIPYFDGKHHIEDIMFLENLERSQVLILCDKFRDILFTCHYEDVAVSQISPFDSTR